MSKTTGDAAVDMFEGVPIFDTEHHSVSTEKEPFPWSAIGEVSKYLESGRYKELTPHGFIESGINALTQYLCSDRRVERLCEAASYILWAIQAVLRGEEDG